jgi:glycosyltransferase involved in cell wall biosynthesis
MTPVGDSGPLAQALVRLANDDALRARLVERARHTARRHDWAATAQRAEAVYLELLSG